MIKKLLEKTTSQGQQEQVRERFIEEQHPCHQWGIVSYILKPAQLIELLNIFF